MLLSPQGTITICTWRPIYLANKPSHTALWSGPSARWMYLCKIEWNKAKSIKFSVSDPDPYLIESNGPKKRKKRKKVRVWTVWAKTYLTVVDKQKKSIKNLPFCHNKLALLWMKVKKISLYLNMCKIWGTIRNLSRSGIKMESQTRIQIRGIGSHFKLFLTSRKAKPNNNPFSSLPICTQRS